MVTKCPLIKEIFKGDDNAEAVAGKHGLKTNKCPFQWTVKYLLIEISVDLFTFPVDCYIIHSRRYKGCCYYNHCMPLYLATQKSPQLWLVEVRHDLDKMTYLKKRQFERTLFIQKSRVQALHQLLAWTEVLGGGGGGYLLCTVACKLITKRLGAHNLLDCFHIQT